MSYIYQSGYRYTDRIEIDINHSMKKKETLSPGHHGRYILLRIAHRRILQAKRDFSSDSPVGF